MHNGKPCYFRSTVPNKRHGDGQIEKCTAAICYGGS